MLKKTLYALLGAAVIIAAAGPAQAQEWRLVNPAGVVEMKPVDPAPRPDSLEGKTVALRWNSKHNGNVALDRIAELLTQEVPSVKIVKIYDDPSLAFTIGVSGSEANSTRIAEAVAAVKPDLVIASTAD